MSESKEADNARRNLSDKKMHQTDWLEQLAGEPDAIWESGPPADDEAKDAAAESAIVEPAKGADIAETTGSQMMPPEDDAAKSLPADAAAEREPAVEGLERMEKQSQTSMRTVESEIVPRLASLPEVDTGDQSSRETVNPSGAELSEIEVNGAGQDSTVDVTLASSPKRTKQKWPDPGKEMTLDIDDLMWLDEMETVSNMNLNPRENEERQPDNETGEVTADAHRNEEEVVGNYEDSETIESDEVPDDPDEAIAWLERLAAKQGAPSEELPTVESSRPPEIEAEHDAADLDYATGMDAAEIPEDPDEAMAWLERLAARQGADSDELTTRQPAVEVELPAVVSGEAEVVAEESDGLIMGDHREGPDDVLSDDLRDALSDSLFEEVEEASIVTSTESLEEATESIAPESVVATSDGASVAAPDEIDSETLSDDTLSDDLVRALDDASTDEFVEADQGALPGDLDEALGWLEELTIQQEPAESALEATAPIAIVDEPPTPAVAHNIDEALAGADLLFAEPEPVDPSEAISEEDVDLVPDEGEDAMAWLEQLAARQGAPIEELTTVDEEPVGEGEQTFGEVVEEVTEETEEQFAQSIDLFDPAQASKIEEAAPEEVPEDAVPGEAVFEETKLAEVVLEQAALEEAGLIEGPATDDWVEPSAGEQEPEEEMEFAAVEDTPAEDLAWLETLGAVDAESWLEAEAAEEQIDADAPAVEAPVEGRLELAEAEMPEPRALVGVLPDAPGSEELVEARRAMQDGEVNKSLAAYSKLVDEGEFLPFLIDDLEAVYERQGPEPSVQRVLGDAYARNGQLRKALETYREALANL